MDTHKHIMLFLAFMVTCSVGVFGHATAGHDGRAFDVGRRFEIVLGRTTEAEVENLFGKPEETDMKPVNDVSHKILTYFHTTNESPLVQMRILEVELKGDTVWGYRLASSFPEDSTTVSEESIERVVEGKTSKAEVTVLLGKPHGRSLLPSFQTVGRKGLEGIVEWWSYRFPILKEANGKQTYAFKSVNLFLDADGIVKRMTQSRN